MCAPTLDGRIVLHYAARSGNLGLVSYILSFWPKWEHLSLKSGDEKTALHFAARSGSIESVKFLLSISPKSQRRQAVCMQTRSGHIVLHYAAMSGNLDLVKYILSVWPESEHLQAICMKNGRQGTVLHDAATSGNSDLIAFLLSLSQRSEHVQVMSSQDDRGMTVLHYAALSARHRSEEAIRVILNHCPKSELLKVVCIQDGEHNNTLMHLLSGLQQFQTVRDILSLLPKEQCEQALNMQNRNGDTVSILISRSKDVAALNYKRLFQEPQRQVEQNSPPTTSTVAEDERIRENRWQVFTSVGLFCVAFGLSIAGSRTT